jgi:hypothetical protein
MSRWERAKTAAEVVKIGVDVALAIIDRRDKKKQDEKEARIRELEAELAPKEAK